MNRYQFDVTGMTCGHCSAKVHNALTPMAALVEVNLETGTVVVETEKPVADILGALKEAGYPGELKS